MSSAARLAGLARHAGGGLAFDLAGETVVCRPSGALWVQRFRALVVADLHFEKGSFFAARGQMLPPYDTAETLRRLGAEIAALDPAMLAFLGDSFHDADGEDRLTGSDAAALAALASGRELIWIAGNHDRAAPRGLPGDAAGDLALGALRLVHEPLAGAAAGEVAGHLHPCARVRARARGASVRRRCFATDGERIVIPAFGALTGGLNIRDGAFAPLFRARPTAAVLGAGCVHAVGWAALRGD